MKSFSPSTKAAASRASASIQRVQGSTKTLVDNRPTAIAQRKLQEGISAKGVQQTKAARNELPRDLKTNIEALSGVSLEGVRVHYNSSKPAEVGALAYAQGNDIYLAPGQEKHLAHEAWHVVQQKQGRVRPTLQLENGVAINDSVGLEQEADRMGLRSGALSSERLSTVAQNGLLLKNRLNIVEAAKAPIQRVKFAWTLSTDSSTNVTTGTIKGRPDKPPRLQVSGSKNVTLTSHHCIDWEQMKSELTAAVNNNNATNIDKYSIIFNVPVTSELKTSLPILLDASNPKHPALVIEWKTFLKQVCWCAQNVFAGPLAEVRGYDPSNPTQNSSTDKTDFHTTASGTVTPKSKVWQEYNKDPRNNNPQFWQNVRAKLSALPSSQSSLDPAEWYLHNNKHYQRGNPNDWQVLEPLIGLSAGEIKSNKDKFVKAKEEYKKLHKKAHNKEEDYQRTPVDTTLNPNDQFIKWTKECQAKVKNLGAIYKQKAEIVNLKKQINSLARNLGVQPARFPSANLSLKVQKSLLTLNRNKLRTKNKKRGQSALALPMKKTKKTNGN